MDCVAQASIAESTAFSAGEVLSNCDIKGKSCVLCLPVAVAVLPVQRWVRLATFA